MDLRRRQSTCRSRARSQWHDQCWPLRRSLLFRKSRREGGDPPPFVGIGAFRIDLGVSTRPFRRSTILLRGARDIVSRGGRGWGARATVSVRYLTIAMASRPTYLAPWSPGFHKAQAARLSWYVKCDRVGTLVSGMVSSFLPAYRPAYGPAYGPLVFVVWAVQAVQSELHFK